MQEAARCSCSAAAILIVDDIAAWRVQVRLLLEKHPALQVVAEACDGFQAIQRAGELHPDLVLLDIGMPVLSGIEAAGHIKRISPQSKVVFLTQDSDADTRTAAFAIGGHGYVLKSQAASELLPTIAAVLHNGNRSNASFGI